jgi:DNA-binding transcriptional ArsR family regulator
MVSSTTLKRAQRASRIFKLASSTSRAHILLTLTKKNAQPVQDIADQVGMTHSAVSHQLGLLLKSKIVTFKKEGRIVRYSIASTGEAKGLVKFLQSLS